MIAIVLVNVTSIMAGVDHLTLHKRRAGRFVATMQSTYARTRYDNDMGNVQLTEREQLIERILHMSDDELAELRELIHDLHDGTDEEIRADNERWDQQFAESQDQLAKLGGEALAEYHTGKTRQFPG
jgi:hypothetical protein